VKDVRVTIVPVVVLLVAMASSRLQVSAAPARHQQPGSETSRTPDPARATLMGTIYDPLGAPVQGMVVSIENGPFGSGVTEETTTDTGGRYAFEKLPPGVYTISLPIDFAPTTEVALRGGHRDVFRVCGLRARGSAIHAA
jgi:protocatechuate 3,4-dioxygenase beta subunit